jgi:hypothetical protein
MVSPLGDNTKKLEIMASYGKSLSCKRNGNGSKTPMPHSALDPDPGGPLGPVSRIRNGWKCVGVRLSDGWMNGVRILAVSCVAETQCRSLLSKRRNRTSFYVMTFHPSFDIMGLSHLTHVATSPQGFHGLHTEVPCDRGCTRPMVGTLA